MIMVSCRFGCTLMMDDSHNNLEQKMHYS